MACLQGRFDKHLYEMCLIKLLLYVCIRYLGVNMKYISNVSTTCRQIVNMDKPNFIKE